MKDHPYYHMSQDITHVSTKSKNLVLRNTYWLLALSMIPTIFGAWLGLTSGLNLFLATNPGTGILIFFLGSFGLFFLIEKFKYHSSGVVILLTFTAFMGLMLSQVIGHVLGFSNGAALIILAFAGTATIFLIMASLATFLKYDFSNLSQWLSVGAIMLLFAIVINIWLQLPTLVLTISSLAIIIFSSYILVDVQRVINGGETNYITATLQIYLNLYNIFVNLLQLITFFSGKQRD